MELLLAIVWPLLLSALIAVALGGVVFLFRRATIKSEAQMTSFLNKRFDVIRRKGFWGKECDYIDEGLIRRWGNNGWSFLGLSAITLSLSAEKFLSPGFFPSFGLLFFAGLFLGDSRAAVFFLRELGQSKYRVDEPNKSLVSTASAS